MLGFDCKTLWKNPQNFYYKGKRNRWVEKLLSRSQAPKGFPGLVSLWGAGNWTWQHGPSEAQRWSRVFWHICDVSRRRDLSRRVRTMHSHGGRALLGTEFSQLCASADVSQPSTQRGVWVCVCVRLCVRPTLAVPFNQWGCLYPQIWCHSSLAASEITSGVILPRRLRIWLENEPALIASFLTDFSINLLRLSIM